MSGEVLDLLTTNIVVDLFYSFYDSKVLLAFVGILVVLDESLPVVLHILGVEHELILDLGVELELVLKPVTHSKFAVDRVAEPKLHRNFKKRHSLVAKHTCRIDQ